jgi:hypothetical protein
MTADRPVAPPRDVASTTDPPSDATRSQPGGALRSAAASPVGMFVLLVGGVLAVDAGGTDEGAGLCVFRRATGGYCPGCGLTRSARHLMRGEVGPAWNDHPWMIFAAVQLAVIIGIWGVARRRARPFDWTRPIQVLAVVNAVALVAIWALRLVDGSIPRFF